ncbi:NAD(P)/FAD-dependent oxidoreductase [Haloparvum sedimenti]|uniref:NAD(P)/FAD-dependent oxidoreductase n=1 Tax=Haloparvum sedimenti TaxID=1678448 RepID=UPI00071E7454|nr:FAD-dependent oxidoreductase [Haloparvum sedimenti]
MSDFDAVVVGGGIVGSAVAYHLADAGADALLVDRRDKGRATDAGAGIVSPATSSRTDSTAWFEFALAAADYYPDLAAELSAAGHDHGYSETSVVVVAADEEEHAELDAVRDRAERRTAEYGRPEPGSVASLAGDALQEAFPPVADGARALRFANAGRVDGRRFATALRAVGRERGLAVRDGEVARIRTNGASVTGVTLADGDRIDASDVVVAGGAWSGAFASDLGTEVPIEPHRGQIAHLDISTVPSLSGTDDWPVVKGFRGHYMVPWPGERIAVGATREEGAGFAPHATLDGIAEVSREALRVAPGLAEARHAETKVGLRPVSADRLPVLGPVPSVEGAHLATGHGATGLQLGPYSGKLVANAVLGEIPAVLDGFGPARF